MEMETVEFYDDNNKLKKLKVGDVIGKGNFGQVFELKDSNYVLKINMGVLDNSIFSNIPTIKYANKDARFLDVNNRNSKHTSTNIVLGTESVNVLMSSEYSLISKARVFENLIVELQATENIPRFKTITSKTGAKTIVFKSANEMREFTYQASEIFIMTKMTHKNLLRSIAFWTDKLNYTFTLGLEPAQYPSITVLPKLDISLDKFIYLSTEMISQDNVLNISIDIISGLAFLHAHDFIHGDIKPENILIDTISNRAIIADFGLATLTLNSKNRKLYDETDYVGTSIYMAPELLRGSIDYTSNVDTWAAACVFAEMCLQSQLFRKETADTMILEIESSLLRNMDSYVKKKKYIEKNYPPISQLVKRMLLVNAEERPTCKQIQDLINTENNFFGDLDIKQVNVIKNTLSSNESDAEAEFDQVNFESFKNSMEELFLFTDSTLKTAEGVRKRLFKTLYNEELVPDETTGYIGLTPPTIVLSTSQELPKTKNIANFAKSVFNGFKNLFLRN